MRQLKQRLLKGESDAFDELYDLLGERLFRYVGSRLRSSQDAADVIQEVFVRLVKSHRRLGRADNLVSYVFTVARNETHRWQQKSQGSIAQSLTGEPPQADTTRRPLDEQEWIKNTLQNLERVDQELIQLKLFSELTFKEIGDVMEMPPASVATRYRRAIQQLQRQLADQQPLTKEQSNE